MSLSARGKHNVDNFMPTISAKVAQRASTQHRKKIDLATAENWLMRGEVVGLLKDRLLEKFGGDDLSYINGLAGCPKLLLALSRLFNEYFNPAIPVQPAHIVTGSGASSVLDSLIFNICDSGDGVLVMAPYWNGFNFCPTIRTAVRMIPVHVPSLNASISHGLTQHLTSAFESTSLVKALILCNPHNPLGQCYTYSALEECLRFCQEKHLHFVCDEIYALSVFSSPDIPDAGPFVSAISLNMQEVQCDLERVHTIWSISKDFGCSGLRLGCLVTQNNRPLSHGVALMANNQISSLTSVAVTSILASPKAVLDSFIATNRQRLAESYATITGFLKFHNMEYFPANAGLYVWAKLSSKIHTWEEEEQLVGRLNEAGVSVGAGRGYHSHQTGWFRITFSVPERTLKKALRRVEDALGLEGIRWAAKV